jgi:hypothetical protein
VDGELGASVPGRCPLGEDGSPCAVARHDRRPRKSGPEHALIVCRCRAHGVYFTVYPPGHVPYGRVAVVAEDSEGRAIQGGEALGATIFGAALEACAQTESRRMQRRTVQRRLGVCAAMLGLATALAESVRDRIADVLSLPRLAARSSARVYGTTRLLRVRSVTVLGLLARVPHARRRVGLLLAGQLAGLWGRPSRWDPGGPMLRPLV